MASVLRQSALVVAAFPGAREAQIEHLLQDEGCPVIDLDSTPFRRTKDGSINPRFIEDYMAALEPYLDKKTMILVSTHAEMRDALIANNIKFVYAGPTAESKDSWLFSLLKAEKLELARLVDENWTSFVSTWDTVGSRVVSPRPFNLAVELEEHYAAHEDSLSLDSSTR